MPQTFFICHFSRIVNVVECVWIASVDWSVECKWMLCVAYACSPTTLPSRSKFVQFDQSQKPVTPLHSLLSLSLCLLPFSYLIVHIGHSNHYQTSSTLLQHFSPASFCSLSSGFASFLFPFSRFSFSVSREGNCAAVVACSLCLSFVYCLMPLMSCQSQGYSINWLSPCPVLPPSGVVTGDLLQPLALKSNFISRQKFWLLVLLCSSLIPFSSPCSLSFPSLSLCCHRQLCDTLCWHPRQINNSNNNSTNWSLIISALQLSVCACSCVCVWKQRKLTKNINYVHEGRNLMRCRCRTEIEAAFLAKRSSRNPREEKHRKKSTRKAAERQHRKNKNNIIYACAFFAW